AILASTAMPIVWCPVDVINFKGRASKQAMDGGLKNNSPLGDIIDFINADSGFDYHIIVINCSSGKVDVQDKRWNIASIALRSLTEIALEEIFNNDIDTFQTINLLVDQAQRQNAVLTKKKDDGTEVPLRKFKATIINPAQGVLGDTLSTDPDLINLRMEHGAKRMQEE